MRVLLALLVLSTPSDQHGRFDRFCSRTDGARSTRGFECGGAQFEAFPASGAGTSGPCSTTAPTGARGEALTFARGSNGTCTKTATGGLATTGIANGDLVVLSTNVARVEYDGAGALGLLTESSRQNTCLRSEAIDDAAWTKASTIIAAPTVTANFATAPDNASTADKVDFPATAINQNSDVFQTMVPAGTSTCSFYARGVSTPDPVDFFIDKGGTFQCGTVTTSATSWTRVIITAVVAGTGTFLIGNDSRASTCGNGTRNATSILVWGVQCEAGAYATSYIPTAGVAVTRSADTAYFATSFATAAGFSTAHTFALESTTNFTGATGLLADATNRTQLYQSGTNSLTADYFSTAGNRSATSVPGAWVVGTPYRVALAYSGAGASSTVSSYLAGVLQNTSATGLTGSWTGTQFGIGLNSPWGSADAIVSRMCLDPSLTRCR